MNTYRTPGKIPPYPPSSPDRLSETGATFRQEILKIQKKAQFWRTASAVASGLVLSIHVALYLHNTATYMLLIVGIWATAFVLNLWSWHTGRSIVIR